MRNASTLTLSTALLTTWAHVSMTPGELDITSPLPQPLPHLMETTLLLISFESPEEDIKK